MDCSENVPNRHFITVLNKRVLITVFELLLFLAIETCVAAGKSLLLLLLLLLLSHSQLKSQSAVIVG